MANSNPFKTSMVRMIGPVDSGPCISVAGFTLFDDGTGFEVPSQIATELTHHGFRPAPDGMQPRAKAEAAVPDADAMAGLQQQMLEALAEIKALKAPPASAPASGKPK